MRVLVRAVWRIIPRLFRDGRRRPTAENRFGGDVLVGRALGGGLPQNVAEDDGDHVHWSPVRG
jgi:hypothetical protein